MTAERFVTGRPLVFAHRGSTAVHPEHTRAAYCQAIGAGVDGAECDVRLTRDGHLVCVHDALLDRTSTGTGRVSDATLEQLRRLSFGDPDTDGVLTLAELLGLLRDAGRSLRLLVETKHPVRTGGEVERRLAQALARHGSTAPEVTVMSFSPLALRRIRELAPALPRVFLFDYALPASVHRGRPPFGSQFFGPGVSALRGAPQLVAQAHERGRQVYVWTVNEPTDIDFVLGLGVDGIISDRPADVLARLDGTAGGG